MLCDEKKYEVDEEKYTETIFSYILYCGVKITKKPFYYATYIYMMINITIIVLSTNCNTQKISLFTQNFVFYFILFLTSKKNHGFHL